MRAEHPCTDTAQTCCNAVHHQHQLLQHSTRVATVQTGGARAERRRADSRFTLACIAHAKGVAIARCGVHTIERASAPMLLRTHATALSLVLHRARGHGVGVLPRMHVCDPCMRPCVCAHMIVRVRDLSDANPSCCGRHAAGDVGDVAARRRTHLGDAVGVHRASSAHAVAVALQHAAVYHLGGCRRIGKAGGAQSDFIVSRVDCWALPRPRPAGATGGGWSTAFVHEAPQPHRERGGVGCSRRSTPMHTAMRQRRTEAPPASRREEYGYVLEG